MMISKMMKKIHSNISIIITAAGASTRFGGNRKKEFLCYNGGTVLSGSIKTFLSLYDTLLNENFQIKNLVVTSPVGKTEEMKNIIFQDKKAEQLLSKVNFNIVEGGSSRQESVYNALKFLRSRINSDNHEVNANSREVSNLIEKELVLIHDGARPFVTEEEIKRVIEAALESGAAIPGIEPTDTFKVVDDNDYIISHPVRKNLRAVQTPQGFYYEKLFSAYQKIIERDGIQKLSEFTDDAQIWGEFFDSIKIVKGEKSNIKITYPSDLGLITTSENREVKALCEASPDLTYLKKHEGTECGENSMIRIGLGYDLHKLVEGRKLIIGGVHFEFEKGEEAHSDGDVLLHAVTDAVLGASGLGDIGSYFPPEDEKWKDADSAFLLQTVMKDIRANGWEIENIDCVVKLEKPKFLPKRNEVISSIAKILNIEPEKVFVKAKTGEKIPPVGTSEAVEAEVVALLRKIQN